MCEFLIVISPSPNSFVILYTTTNASMVITVVAGYRLKDNFVASLQCVNTFNEHVILVMHILLYEITFITNTQLNKQSNKQYKNSTLH